MPGKFYLKKYIYIDSFHVYMYSQSLFSIKYYCNSIFSTDRFFYFYFYKMSDKKIYLSHHINLTTIRIKIILKDKNITFKKKKIINMFMNTF